MYAGSRAWKAEGQNGPWYELKPVRWWNIVARRRKSGGARNFRVSPGFFARRTLPADEDVKGRRGRKKW